jgi:copper transport protein
MILSDKNQYFGKRLAFVLRLVCAAAIFASAAFGHAKLVESAPANGEKLNAMPKAVMLTFSAQLQSTEINSIVVTDSSGKRVNKNTLILTADGKKMVAPLDEIAAGTFKVEWKALSADDHLMKGEFSFTVAATNTPETATPTPPTDAPQISETAPPTVETQSAPAEKSGTNPLQSLVRWLAYLALMTLFGGFAFALSVMEPALKTARNLSDAEKLQAFGIARKKFIGLSYLSLSLIFLSALAALILQTSTVLEINLAQSLNPSNLWKVLTQTAYGVPWFLQIAAALAVFVVVVLIGKRKNDASPEAAFGGKPLFWTGLIFSALLLATLSLTGHARAAQKDYAFAVASDWLHLVAAGVWVGGIFQLALVLPKAAGALSSPARISLLARVIARFSALAVAATALLALTGIYNSWIHLTSVRDLITTPYGITLTVKIILFLLMMPLGAFNRFFIRPRVEKLAAEPESGEHSKTVKDFYFVMILETAFAVAILLLAAILAFLPHSQEHHAAAANASEYIALNAVERNRFEG